MVTKFEPGKKYTFRSNKSTFHCVGFSKNGDVVLQACEGTYFTPADPEMYIEHKEPVIHTRYVAWIRRPYNRLDVALMTYELKQSSMNYGHVIEHQQKVEYVEG